MPWELRAIDKINIGFIGNNKRSSFFARMINSFKNSSEKIRPDGLFGELITMALSLWLNCF